ncbi:MAG TPA: trehalose-6-phosphate synthase [Tahibacter sp.]|uniref:alpha,alpha-trehalose-phosphate synthase (UDP-forming) n=1 Tax=Tahibacter sp. TaxID=2056211 RepID=UPI002CF45BE7|nr:trehalose-6-phosphate synthase [Tahibacter sp.]HSX62839.1 trehalose-6-phosphate synthase [Tahibacter sp.]
MDVTIHAPEEHAIVSNARDAANDGGRLIVVSNRVTLPGSTQPGGLATALLALLQQRGGSWMGWSGAIADSVTPRAQQHGRIRYVTWDLPREEFESFYAEYANRTLWPLLHGRTDLMAFEREHLQGYLRVNERFAEQVAREARPDDLIWIHDYHLMPLASLLRARGLNNCIGFFLHTPLPAPRTLVTLPQHRAMLGLLAACNLVGLQTANDARAMKNYLMAELGAVERDGALHLPGGEITRVRTFPIGIDPAAMAALARESEHAPEIQQLRNSLGRSSLVIGVDRLDYSKGLPQRLRAFRHLLGSHPQLAGRATFLQVTPESRREVSEYRQLSREVQRLVGDINGHYAAPAWTPVRYVNRGYSHATLAGFYRLARVCLVTPLRDGMNLVAKEFIACQHPQDPGVLVLSEFAGAAAELAECALIVNPYDIEGCSRALARALTMPLDERLQRWQAAMRILQEGNVQRWAERFLSALAGARRPPQRAAVNP